MVFDVRSKHVRDRRERERRREHLLALLYIVMWYYEQRFQVHMLIRRTKSYRGCTSLVTILGAGQRSGVLQQVRLLELE